MEEKKNKILSVVIPAYNAEKTIRNTLDSLVIEAVLPLLDVIVINDGSTDGTSRTAGIYSSRYPDSFRVIDKPNGGHGSGINYGIQLARGRYFKVLDADDWVDKDAMENFVRYLVTADDDIVWSGFYWAYEKKGICTGDFHRKAEFTEPFEGVTWRKTYVFDALAEKLYIKMHNMTFRTSLLQEHHIHVDEHLYYVDTEYILYPIPYVKTVSFLPDFVYMYRIGMEGQSMSREKMRENEKSINRVLKSLFRFYESLGKEIPCSEPKKHYVENLIARVISGKYRMMLCGETSLSCMRRMKKFDRMLKERYPRIYAANQNKAVTLLRKSGFYLYQPAAMLVKKVYQ